MPSYQGSFLCIERPLPSVNKKHACKRTSRQLHVTLLVLKRLLSCRLCKTEAKRQTELKITEPTTNREKKKRQNKSVFAECIAHILSWWARSWTARSGVRSLLWRNWLDAEFHSPLWSSAYHQIHSLTWEPLFHSPRQRDRQLQLVATGGRIRDLKKKSMIREEEMDANTCFNVRGPATGEGYARRLGSYCDFL